VKIAIFSGGAFDPGGITGDDFDLDAFYC